jgi:hypothetical protein
MNVKNLGMKYKYRNDHNQVQDAINHVARHIGMMYNETEEPPDSP